MRPFSHILFMPSVNWSCYLKKYDDASISVNVEKLVAFQNHASKEKKPRSMIPQGWESTLRNNCVGRFAEFTLVR